MPNYFIRNVADPMRIRVPPFLNTCAVQNMWRLTTSSFRPLLPHLTWSSGPCYWPSQSTIAS